MLTTEQVKSLTPPAKGNRITYDGRGGVPGFGVRVTAAGAKAYVISYRTKAYIERRLTIGAVSVWGANPKRARDEAKRILRIVDAGGDPLGEQRAERQAPTVRDLAQRAVEEHFSRKSESLRKDVDGQLAKWILPAIGNLKVEAVRPSDIEAVHRKVTRAGSPIRANRCVSTLSRMFVLAKRWGYRADNPAASATDANPETSRRRYLTPDELGRLLEVLAAVPDQSLADMLRMCLLTGARSGEVMSARFDQFQDGVWHKRSSEVKQRRGHDVKVSPPVAEIIARRRAATNGEHLFPGRGQPHLTNVYRSWATICAAAKLDDFRIHDLRHSAASFLVSGGWTLGAIGAVLGHSRTQTTSRYAHLLPDAEQAAVDQLGAIVTQQPSAEVIKLGKG
jgi:integrase